jgi:hypothetical protein
MKIVAALPNVQLLASNGDKIPVQNVPMDGLGVRPKMLPNVGSQPPASTVNLLPKVFKSHEGMTTPPSMVTHKVEERPLEQMSTMIALNNLGRPESIPLGRTNTEASDTSMVSSDGAMLKNLGSIHSQLTSKSKVNKIDKVLLE